MNPSVVSREIDVALLAEADLTGDPSTDILVLNAAVDRMLVDHGPGFLAVPPWCLSFWLASPHANAWGKRGVVLVAEEEP